MSQEVPWMRVFWTAAWGIHPIDFSRIYTWTELAWRGAWLQAQGQHTLCFDSELPFWAKTSLMHNTILITGLTLGVIPIEINDTLRITVDHLHTALFWLIDCTSPAGHQQGWPLFLLRRKNWELMTSKLWSPSREELRTGNSHMQVQPKTHWAKF